MRRLTRVASLASLASLALPACSDKGNKESSEVAMPSNKVEEPVDRPATGTWLLLRRLDQAAGTAGYTPVAIRASRLEVGAAIAVEPFASKHTRGATSLASMAGGVWYAAVQSGGRWALHKRDFAAPAADPVNIPLEVDEVTALLAVDHRVVVGAGNKVGYIDTSAGDLTFVKLAERPGAYKAYDVLSRDGDLVAAIDDVVMPIYGELLSIDADRISHVEGWQMPSFINGTYGAAVLSMSDAAAKSGVLYGIGAYGIMSGNGQDLFALPIRAGKLEAGDMSVINSGGAGRASPPVLEEHVSRSTGKVEKIIAGSEMTRWTGLALAPGGERIALAAGSRGLLLVPSSFGPGTRATAVDVGGACLDVVSAGGVLYALVDAAGRGKLAVIDGTSVINAVDLPAVHQSFVR